MEDVLSDTPSQGEFARRDVTILLMPRFGVETDLAVHDVNSYGPKFARDHFTTRRAKTAGQDSAPSVAHKMHRLSHLRRMIAIFGTGRASKEILRYTIGKLVKPVIQKSLRKSQPT